MPQARSAFKQEFSLSLAIAVMASLTALTSICASQSLIPPSSDLRQDADRDGMTDVDEILWKMDPLNPMDGPSDPDGDLLSFAWEYELGTDPSLADTDMDGWSDSDELLLYGTDPLSAASFPLTNPAPKSADAGMNNPVTPDAELSPIIPAPPPQPSLDNGDFTDVKFAIRDGEKYIKQGMASFYTNNNKTNEKIYFYNGNNDV